MQYICACGWHILIQMFSCQIICAHPMDAAEDLHFPGTFMQTPGLSFSDIPQIPRTCITFVYVAGIFYFKHLAAKLFVHILQLLWKFHSFLNMYMGRVFFFLDILHIPRTCSTFSHMSDILYLDIWLLNYLCTSCRCSENSAFFWDIYMDTKVAFLLYSTCPGEKY